MKKRSSEQQSFNIQIEKASHDPKMYLAGLFSLIYSDKLQDFKNSFFPKLPDKNLLDQILKGVSFLQSENLITEELIDQLCRCIFGILTSNQVVNNPSILIEVDSILLHFAKSYSCTTMTFLLSSISEIQSLKSLISIMECLLQNFEPQILSDCDYSYLSLRCAALFINFVSVSKDPDSVKLTYLKFLDLLMAPLSQNPSKEPPKLPINIIEMQQRFIPADLMNKYSELIKNLYFESKLIRYVVNLSGIPLSNKEMDDVTKILNDETNFHSRFFVHFYFTKILQSPVEICDKLIKLVSSKRKLFGKKPTTAFIGAIIQILTLRCAFLNDFPSNFNELLKVGFLNILGNKDELSAVCNDVRDFVAAASSN
jgi:hypothetical protein